MNFFKRFDILPVILVVTCLFFIFFIRVHHPAGPANGAPSAAGGLMSYNGKPGNEAPVPDANIAAASTCFNSAQYTMLLNKAKSKEARLSGTAALDNGRRLEIFQADGNGTFTILSVGTNGSGTFSACPIANGKNLQLSGGAVAATVVPTPPAPPPVLPLAIPAGAPATAPR